jgi:hypothetical protein
MLRARDERLHEQHHRCRSEGEQQQYALHDRPIGVQLIVRLDVAR